jgi:hypothetical protein
MPSNRLPTRAKTQYRLIAVHDRYPTRKSPVIALGGPKVDLTPWLFSAFRLGFKFHLEVVAKQTAPRSTS